MRSQALAVALVLVAAVTVRADPGVELGRSDKGRRWQIGQGTDDVLVAVDAKWRAASWDTSFHDDAVAEARAERQQELGGAIAFAGVASLVLGACLVAHHPRDGLAFAGGGWIGLGAGSVLVAAASPDPVERGHHGRRRRHH